MALLVVRSAVAAAALVLTLVAHAHIPVTRTAQNTDFDAPRAATARLTALDFDAMVADFYWLRAVQMVGAEEQNPALHARSISRLVDLVVGLDPYVDHPYRFAALWMSDDPATLPAANRMLERGIAYHPTDWRDRFYLSFNYFFLMRDSAAATRELAPAVGLPGAPAYLPRLLARLRSEGGDLEAAAAYLEGLLEHETDGFHRAEYEKALDEIETERRARLLDQARDRFRAETGRDIARVEELAGAVLPALPPEPHGWEWVIDASSGRIVSSYYRRRYQLAFQSELGGLHAKGGR